LIGAKYDSEGREQKVKGVIAHELCHYILGIVFENNDNPYYKCNIKIREEFEMIVERIKNSIFNSLASKEEELVADDRCNGIVSTVYTLYNSEDHPPELIVRVLHILAQYGNDENKSNELENKYEILFKFFEKYVLPELKSFNLESRLKIRKFNKKSENLSKIKKEEYILKDMEKGNEVLNSALLTVVFSNIPELVYSNIYANLRNDDMIDVKNIFIYSNALDKKRVFNDVDKSLKNVANIRIFINCSEGISKNVKDLVKNKKDINIIVVTTTENREKFSKMWKNVNIIPKEVNIDYKFDDLSSETKQKILQKEIQFQNAKTTLFNLLSSDEDIDMLNNFNKGLFQKPPQISKDFEIIINEELLKLFIKKLPINIDPRVNEQFDHKVQQRKFYKNDIYKNILSNEEFLNDIETENIVFINGDFGSGKSWTLRYLTNTLREKYPKKWISYINLQEYAKDVISSELNFYVFVAEHVLKLKNNFEKKLFNFLCQNGNAIFLLDDFNDGSLDMRESVNKLVGNLRTGNTNKFLIATRNINDWNGNLQKHGIEYVLDDFSIDNGIELLKDYFSENANKEEFLKNAKKLVVELLKISKISLNMPLFYRIIAQFISNNKQNLCIFNAFKYYVNNEYSRHQKSVVAKEQSIFNEQHWHLSLDNLFPTFKTSYTKRENVNYTNIETYGFVTKNNINYCFVNNVFRDYFFANYLLTMLKEGKNDEKFIKMIILILHLEVHSGIRVLFNSALSDDHLYQQIKMNTKSLANKLDKEINLLEIIKVILKENLDNFVKLLEIIFGKTKSDLIEESLKDINPVENLQVFKMVKALLKLLKSESVGNYIINKEIFHKLIDSDIQVNEAKQFARELDNMKLVENLRKGLQVQTKSTGENIVHIASRKPFKIKETFELLMKFLSPGQRIELLQQKDINGNTFLHTFAQNDHQDSINTNLSYHKVIWDELFENFNDEELEELMLERNNEVQTFYHIYITQDNAKEIEESFKFLNEKKDVCKAVLNFNHFKDRNLLQIAASYSTSTSALQVLWKIYEDNYKTNQKFIEVLKRCDNEGKNILQIAACTAGITMFDLLLSNIGKTFEKHEKKKVIRSFFNSIDGKEMNLLQLAAKENMSIDFHKNLWEKIEKYFDDVDICELVNYVDKNGSNMLSYAKKHNAEQIFRFLHKNVRKFINKAVTNQTSFEAKTEVVEESNQIVARRGNVF